MGLEFVIRTANVNSFLKKTINPVFFFLYKITQRSFQIIRGSEQLCEALVVLTLRNVAQISYLNSARLFFHQARREKGA